MAIEITNSLRASSLIRAEGAGTYYANVVSLAANANEVVTAANIRRINWSTNGSVTISRNANTIITLYDTGEIRLDEWGHSIANNNISNVQITIATGGTVLIEMTKTATYTTPLTDI